MSANFDVCVRGAGVTGHVQALLLARLRLRVALVERVAPAHGPDVRAYALNAASRQLLESLKAWPSGPDATPVLSMDVHGDDGGRVAFSAAQAPAGALAWIVDVPALERELANACRYQPGITKTVEPVSATLTVVCEGRASATRADFGVEFDVTPYPHHAIAARLTCAQPHGGVAFQWFSHGEVLAFLPLGGPQGNSVALVWSVSRDRCAGLLALDDAAFSDAVASAGGHRLGAMQLSSERAAWPLQHAMARRWTGPGWALVGDAAHAVHPLAGQGLNLGLADAAELADRLEHREYWRGIGDERLLRRYERTRKLQVTLTGRFGDGMQVLFDQPGEMPRRLRNLGMNGFDRMNGLKQWMAQRAAGTSFFMTEQT
ncbi:MAG: FAD-dependent monooxygenase [Ramlibacter sp.]|nr:FAD-dependent monooxygenase [Ramlibacter sp.]